MLASKGRLGLLALTLLAMALCVTALWAQKAGAAEVAHTSSPDADFVGHWSVDNGVGFTITSQSGGSCEGTSDYESSGYDLIDCAVSGDDYSFTITYGSDYESYNTGTITGNTLVGEFHDTNGTQESYAGERSSGTISGAVSDEQCSDTSCKLVGLGDIDLDVTGTDANGDTVDETATSANDGTWSIDLDPGSYTVTPDPDGFDPESSPPITLAVGQTVPNINFQTCEGTLDSTQPLARGARAPLTSTSASNGCVGTYAFTLGANIPQTKFVDPAADSAGSDDYTGGGYPKHNYTTGKFIKGIPVVGTVIVNNTNASYPQCDFFDYYKRVALTKADDAVQWRDYFKGSPDLGTVNVTLAWNRHTKQVTPTIVDTSTGSMTRVFDYTINGKPGSCDSTGTITPDAAVAASGNTFVVMVAWSFPFEASGGAKLSDLTPKPPKAVATTIDNALKSIPGWNTLPTAKKVAAQKAAAEAVAIISKAENCSLAAAAKKFSDEVDALVKVGAGELLEGPLGILNAITTVASAAFDGYPTMDAVIRGQFNTLPYQKTGHLQMSTGTRLIVQATTDQFPDYTMVLRRNSTTLPWSSEGQPLTMVNTFTTPTFNHTLGLPYSWLNDADQGATATGKVQGGPGAKSALLSAMQVVKNVFLLGLNKSTSSNSNLAVGAPDTITYKFMDGKP